MDSRQRSRLAGGLILVLLGVWFLLLQIVPGLQAWVNSSLGWPLIVIAAGLLLLLLGLLLGVPAIAIPACILAGIGGLLSWQNATGNWASWAYAWTLIPGFVGVGIILSGLLERRVGRSLQAGAWVILISLILFLIFGSFLGGQALIGPYWPVVLVVLGVLLLLRAFVRFR